MDLLRYLFGSTKRDQFAEKLVRRVKEAGETREIRYERETYQISFFDQGELAGVANLGNIFTEYDRLFDHQREDFLGQITRAILSHHKAIPEAFEDARPDILPIVRSRSYLDLGNLERRLQGDQSNQIAYLPLCEHLLTVPIYDLPEAIRTIDQRRFDQWNCTLYELMEVALDNLNQVPAQVSVLDGRVYLFHNQDNYDAARMLLTERINQFDLEGRPVAMIPQRDILIVTGEQDSAGLKRMLELVKQRKGEPRPISFTPCVLTEDLDWETWFPPPEDPLYAEFYELHLAGLAGEYREQRQAIETTLAQTHRAGFVANFYLFRDRQTGKLHSYCVWPDCPYALLPRTDFVVFLDQNQNHPIASGTWQTVARHVGSQMEDLQCYPPRYRVLGFPGPDELKAIGTLERFRFDV